VTTQPTPAAIWAGRIASALMLLVLVADGAIDLFAPDMMRAEIERTGWTVAASPMLGAIVLISALLYAIPRTKVLGAILITGFFGGAIATHVRLGEGLSPPVLVSIVVGVLTWGGLWLRDVRMRALLPLS